MLMLPYYQGNPNNNKYFSKMYLIFINFTINKKKKKELIELET